METTNTPNFESNPELDKNVIQSKEYEFKIKENKFKVIIDIYSNQTIHFYAIQLNKLSMYYYEKEFTYDEIIRNLILVKDLYKDISSVLDFYNKSIRNEQVILMEKIVNEKKILILNMQRILDYHIKQCNIELEEKHISNDELFLKITEEINDIKIHQPLIDKILEFKYDFNEEKIKILETKIKKIEEENEKEKEEKKKLELKQINELKNNYNEEIIKKLEEKIKTIEKEREEDKEEMKQIKKMWEKEKNELKDEIKNLKEENKRFMKLIEKKNKKNKKSQQEEEEKEEEDQEEGEEENLPFRENPCGLKYIEDLANDNSCGGVLCNFAVFIGLKDNTEYIVYNNKFNHNLEIMRISDKTKITSLKGHNNNTSVIRYHKNDNKEEYILSCDYDKLVIVWDIQNNYNIKYNIREEYTGNILDALLLFNVYDLNYILVSSENRNEYSKFYLFEENTPFIKIIYGSNENNTIFMIPWFYNKEYYIIECCDSKISINNILEDECYANLKQNSNDCNYCGYIYNDNYLCVSDFKNECIRIWDLVNKVNYKEIKYNAIHGYEIIPWNNEYTIIGCKGGIAIINIEEGKLVKSIELDYTYVGGLKKMKLNKFGECLVVSDGLYNIKLYSILKKK